MPIDYQEKLFDVAYDRMGVPATIVTTRRKRHDVTVIDKTAQLTYPSFGPVEVTTFKPAAMVRMKEILDLDLSLRDDIKDGQLVMNGKIWTIGNWEPHPTLNGIDDGEALLLLRDDADV